jgi:hypothetical protein
MRFEDILRAHAEHNPGWRRGAFPRRRCADGFEISVQVGYGMYCSPRESWSNPHIGLDDPAPPVPRYSLVECGYPNAIPEPWPVWREYAECADDPLETVYGYVPVEIVQALLDSHGGEVEPSVGDVLAAYFEREP